MIKVRRALIVTAAIAPLARQLAGALPSGDDMFVAGYSPTGEAPATHYVSDGDIDETIAAALTSPETLVSMLAQWGQVMSLAQATALLSQAVVDEREATAVLAEMGLLPVVNQ